MKTRHNDTVLLALATLLLALGYLLHLGLQPLYLEEPRRLFIGLEMQYYGQLWTPVELGEYYYRKPPLFNWVLLAFGWFFGSYQEWVLRLPTVLSAFGIAALQYGLGRRYVSPAFGRLAALLWLVSIDILFYFSTLAEIDLFYSLLTFGSFAALFHFHQQGRYGWMFLLTYSLAALGFLTKGLPALVFQGVSLLVWLTYRGDSRRLLSWRHLAGIALFLLLTAGYFAIYSRYTDPLPFLRVLLGESGDRTALASGAGPLFRHLFVWPLDTLKNLLPGALLLLFAFRRDLGNLLLRNDWIAFGLVVGMANFAVYWISPGSRQRYIYMLFPLFLNALTWIYLQRRTEPAWPRTVFRNISALLLGLASAGSLALLFLPGFDALPGRIAIAAGFSLAFLALLLLWRRQPELSLALLILALAVSRLLFDLTVLPQRARSSGATYDKTAAEQIYKLTGDAPLYLYGDDRISYTTVAYLDLQRRQPVIRRYQPDSTSYFLAEKGCLLEDGHSFEELLTFDYDKREYVLVRLN